MPIRLPTLSLRRWILWPLIGAFLVSVLLILLFAQGAAESAARDLGNTYAREVGERIEDPLAMELQALRRRVEINAEAMRAGRLSADDPLDVSPWLYDQLRQARHFTFLSFAWPDGRYLGAARLPGDEAVHLSSNFIGEPFQLVGYAAGPDGRPAGPYGREGPKPYDPRERSFYRRALASGGPSWGSIESYVGWTVFGIGHSAPVHDAEGRLLAVAGGAIALERLADVLAGLDMPEGSIALVADREGLLVASSDRGRLALGVPGQAQRVALADHPHPAARRLSRIVQDGSAERPGILRVDGEDYLYDLRRLRAPEELGWWIAVVLPEDGFTAPIRLGRERLLALVALVMLVVAALGMALSRAVVGPVERLGAAAARGELDELARREATGSPVREVGRLSQALGDLAEALKRGIAELEDRVQARTRELEDANAQLLALSLRDPLTGVGNRRSFDEALVREWAAAVRRRDPLALLLVDVDHFKDFNDRHGHLVGDAVLRAIAQTIGGVMRRATDQLARFGGEEFVVLMPGTGPAEALVLAERLRAAVGALEVAEGVGAVTVSIGLAVASPGPSDAPSDLVASADAALYRAKAGGRDRTEVAGSPSA